MSGTLFSIQDMTKIQIISSFPRLNCNFTTLLYSIAQWDLLSYVAKMVSIVVLCTHRQTVFQIAKSHHAPNNKKGGREVWAAVLYLLSQAWRRFNSCARVFSFFVFFTNFPNFQGKYLLSGNYRKHETFCLNCGCSKVPLDVELYHGPLRPFEKIKFENVIFMK